MVTGYPKEVESPSLEGFQRCVDESAAVTIKKKDMVSCWRMSCVFSILKILQFFKNSVLRSYIFYHMKMEKTSDLSVQKLSRIRHSGQPSLWNAECGLTAHTWESFRVLKICLFLNNCQKRSCPQNTNPGDPYCIDDTTVKHLLLLNQQFLGEQSPGHVSEVIAGVLFVMTQGTCLM